MGWVDYILDLAHTYNRSEILLRNFAYAGATISRNIVTPADPSILCLDEQVRQGHLIYEIIS